jgi:hypothetical protein
MLNFTNPRGLIALLLLTDCHARYTIPPGGYPYPKHPDGLDTSFYLYPLKDTLSLHDSLNHVWDGYFFQAFDEPNLSLRPCKTPEYRFSRPGYRSFDDLLIILTPKNLIVKRRKADNPRVTTDTSKISPLERHLLNYMDRNFGRSRPDSNRYPGWYRYIDSMERHYPEVKDADFYITTVRRELIPNPAFRPCQTIIRNITEKEYQTFVDTLNASGYWQMPYVRKCNEQDLAIDGPSYFSLEANTPDRYNFVSGYPCPNDTNLFYKACDHLARMAGLQKEIDLLWIESAADTAHSGAAR